MKPALPIVILGIIFAACGNVYAPGGADDCATLTGQLDACGNSYRLGGDEPGARCRRYGDEQGEAFFPAFPYPDACRETFSPDSCCTPAAEFYDHCIDAPHEDPYACLFDETTCDEESGLIGAVHGCGAGDR